MVKFVITSQIRKRVHELGYEVSLDYINTLNDLIESQLKKSSLRANANDRKTLTPKDIDATLEALK